MKYFIDFEATQYSEEVISIGCIREDGQTFYSLVAPVDGKITPFITNLTGITAEAVANAMSPDAVFEKFYDWAFSDREDNPDFYCWGNSDVGFLQNTFKRTTSFQARLAIGYMCGSMLDYSRRVAKRANMYGKSLALLQVWKCFEPNATQNHNALDDAVMLYSVYQEVEKYSKLELEAILCAKYQSAAAPRSTTYVRWTQMNYPVGTICIIDKHKVAKKTFADEHEAAKWIFEEKVDTATKCITNTNINNIEKKIVKAYTNGTPYFNMKWVIVPEEVM
jgi:inhibitor of KinA sporulation pathway (predicted exonuclease)